MWIAHMLTTQVTRAHEACGLGPVCWGQGRGGGIVRGWAEVGAAEMCRCAVAALMIAVSVM